MPRAACHPLVVARVAGRALAVALVAASGCGFDADYGGTRLRCPPSSPACPDGFTCIAEVCMPAGGPDARPGDGGPDASVCELAAQVADNDVCAAAIDLTAAALAPGGTVVHGDTTGYAANLAPTTLPGCTGNVAPGPDAIYQLALAAGDDVALALTPLGYDGAVYVLDACSAAASCRGGGDAPGAGSIDQGTVAIATAGTYYVVVDTSSSTATGCYTLAVTITR